MHVTPANIVQRTIHSIVAALCCAACCGCGIVRVIDYKIPAIRFDRATNRPLPDRKDPAVREALGEWRGLSEEDLQRFPTPYHAYVNTPAPGTFEGNHTVGLAFSGGGTRGTIFCGYCLNELEKLGSIIVQTDNGPTTIRVWDEVDYVSGVSTGAIPATVYALDRAGKAPEGFQLDNWPECFNRDLIVRSLKVLALRPHLIVRDMLVDMNSRPPVAGAIAAAFFEGKIGKPGSGLTFGELPATPILFLGSTVINDPGVPFEQTRLPYRYAVDTYPDTPWGVGIQSFESIHSDPMQYGLAEACYNSMAFPGYLRSGLLTVREDRPWVRAGLPGPARDRMRRARRAPGYEDTCYMKDGGLIDNRGVSSLDRIFEGLACVPHQPLLIGLDAGYRELRKPEQGGKLLKKGWFNEVHASSRASWQTGQDAFERLFAAHGDDGAYAYARFRFVAWVPYLSEEKKDTPEARHLENLCRQEPLVRDPDRLLELTRGIGTTFVDLSDEQLAAVRVTAKFAVWHDCHRLLRWASDAYNGASAAFEHAPPRYRFPVSLDPQ